MLNNIINYYNESTTKSKEYVNSKDIKLIQTKGTPNRGGGKGGESWKIEVNNKRVGIVFINLIDEPPIGKHASIQIYLNKQNQGKHIGIEALKKACQLSKYKTIYGHVRKSNIASVKMNEKVGFKDVSPPGYKQLIFRFKK
jgi:L-amino acid N-acyltransferase YncA